ncbi:uncharacterized protein Z518_01014 [Rhinocladiella mackenziei CBS 650.93]|uniref:Probable aspartic-type endopeptidase OPSB n=1 Tax=Rhinocladiella mackenziei CBS 650.93 TaxID=1442369 RepID=A0A0D2HGY9_9EURO|nr:uncharacterized protein Z518_01014 [Rhinocladiella mackenziei CBS 650.93]KIX09933.1 hypothetical protein Z518_01014 [Rhinocladiella mackenziei CBS 650.93]
MRSSTAVAAVAALTAPLVSAIHLAPRSSNPRVISLPIERRNIPDILAHEQSRLRKRQGTVEQTLDNEESLYYANLSLGTPEQSLRLHIDTGSSDLWVNTPDSSFCSSATNPCEGGTYDPSASSTYKFVNDEFNISYVDGSGAIGDYVTDTLHFGGHTLNDFQFGIGETSSSQQGVLGIGYASNEVQVNRAGLDPYPNLPEALVNASLIASNAYSLWLNDLDASTGEILFGGVNTEKYEGDLATMPIIQTYGGYYELVVALTGMTVAGTDLSSSSSLPAGVLLDSGSTLSYLPDDITQEIYNQVQAVYQPDVGAAYAECSLASSDATLDFDFSGQTISVPYNELFLNAGTNNFGQPLTFTNGEEACLFGIAPTLGGTALLGDTFLRSAYVVYDLANNEISLAQTVFNSTSDNIQEITTGTDSVPNASPVANPVTDVAGATGGARLGAGAATATVTGFSDPTDTANAASLGKSIPFGSSMGAVFAVAVAVLAL